jgi:hypothetical protein
MFAKAFRCIGPQRTVAFSHSHAFPIVSSMKPFSASILVLSSLALLAACTAQEASVTGTDDWTMDDTASSSHSGPYLELEEDDEDTVELRINTSSSSFSS